MQSSLREAAQQVGASKSTILRAVKSGRLSASRTDDNGYLIDPAELLRVYPPERAMPRSAAQSTPGGEAVAATPDAVETRIRYAGLEAELKALRELLDAEKRRGEEIRQERDQWREQVQRLLLSSPLVTPAPSSEAAPPRSRWRWWQRQAS